MEFKPYTGMVRLQYQSIARRFAEWYEGWAAEFGLHPETLNNDLVDYLQLAIRAIPNGKKAVSWAVTLQDDEDTAKAKYLSYLNLETHITRQWASQLNALDAPADPVLAPDAELPEDDEKNG